MDAGRWMDDPTAKTTAMRCDARSEEYNRSKTSPLRLIKKDLPLRRQGGRAASVLGSVACRPSDLPTSDESTYGQGRPRSGIDRMPDAANTSDAIREIWRKKRPCVPLSRQSRHKASQSRWISSFSLLRSTPRPLSAVPAQREKKGSIPTARQRGLLLLRWQTSASTAPWERNPTRLESDAVRMETRLVGGRLGSA
jgi:hypothetical protein